MVFVKITGAAVPTDTWWDLSKEDQEKVPRIVVIKEIPNNDFFKDVPFDTANEMLDKA